MSIHIPADRVMGEYGVITIVAVLGFIASTLWVFRKIATGIYQMEYTKASTLFNCLLR